MSAATARLALAAALLLPSFAVAADPPSSPAAAPSPVSVTAPATPAPPAPPSPVSGIRSKLSASDLLSAESILEVHEQKHGRDVPWVEGLGWLARGAWMLGERDKAKRYADAACRECETRVAGGADLEKEPGLAGALGASIEVEAQIRRDAKGAAHAARYLDEQLARWPKPVSLRSRLNKRRNLMTMVGERDKAKRYADAACRECETRVAGGADLEKEPGLAGALGASIEVEAQIRRDAKGAKHAARYLDEQLARWPKPVSLRSRLNKRRNLMTMVGERAPELVVEDHVGPAPRPLAALRGRPVVLFLWAEWCGDCKAQAASLARVKSKYAARGLEVVALTRYYGDEPRAVEKARVDSMWAAVYPAVGEIPRVFSTASMERYGGSATPTFVFVDRDGVVRDYTPTRLTEEELDRRVAAIAR